MAEYDLISKTALLKHLDMAIECKDCPRNANKELYECVHNSTPQRCTCSEIAQICIRITDFETSSDVQPVKKCKMIPQKTDCRGYTDVFLCTNCQLHIHLGFISKNYGGNFCLECGAEVEDGEQNEVL
jgi:hypothetical protein